MIVVFARPEIGDGRVPLDCISLEHLDAAQTAAIRGALAVAVADGSRYRLLVNYTGVEVRSNRGIFSRVAWQWFLDDCLSAV